MSGGLQTSVAYASPKAIPGQIADINDCQLVTAVCTSTVLPGTWVELTLAADGETFIAKSPNSTVGTLGDGGVAVYDPMQDPLVLKALGSTSAPTGTGFPIGMPITVLRRGRVFVATDAATTAGSTGLLFGAANVQHPSSTAASATNTNGNFTIVATNTTAGTETTAANGVSFLRAQVDTNVALVDVNRPKAG
jgi:hypothetical protein